MVMLMRGAANLIVFLELLFHDCGLTEFGGPFRIICGEPNKRFGHIQCGAHPGKPQAAFGQLSVIIGGGHRVLQCAAHASSSIKSASGDYLNFGAAT